MRGKHASAAERRRAYTELEQRAHAAEQQVARQSSELDRLKASSEQRITGLRRQLAEIRSQAEQAAVPAVAMLEEQNRQLRDQAKAASSDMNTEIEHRQNLGRAIMRILLILGFSLPEAMEIMYACEGWDVSITGEFLGVSTAANLSSDAVQMIQAAKGNRPNNALAIELKRALGGRVKVVMSR